MAHARRGAGLSPSIDGKEGGERRRPSPALGARVPFAAKDECGARCGVPLAHDQPCGPRGPFHLRPRRGDRIITSCPACRAMTSRGLLQASCPGQPSRREAVRVRESVRFLLLACLNPLRPAHAPARGDLRPDPGCHSRQHNGTRTFFVRGFIVRPQLGAGGGGTPGLSETARCGRGPTGRRPRHRATRLLRPCNSITALAFGRGV